MSILFLSTFICFVWSYICKRGTTYNPQYDACICPDNYQGWDETDCFEYEYTLLGSQKYVPESSLSDFGGKYFCEKFDVTAGEYSKCDVFWVYPISDKGTNWLGIFDGKTCGDRTLEYPQPTKHRVGWMEKPIVGCDSLVGLCDLCSVTTGFASKHTFSLQVLVREYSASTIYNPVCWNGTDDCFCYPEEDWNYDKKNFKCSPICNTKCGDNENCFLPDTCVCNDGFARKDEKSSCKQVKFAVEVTTLDYAGIKTSSKFLPSVNSHQHEALDGFIYEGVTVKFQSQNQIAVILDDYNSGKFHNDYYLPKVYDVVDSITYEGKLAFFFSIQHVCNRIGGEIKTTMCNQLVFVATQIES